MLSDVINVRQDPFGVSASRAARNPNHDICRGKNCEKLNMIEVA
jgi:hypothetical protein